MTRFDTTAQDRQLAYDHVSGHSPTIVFLGGFRSDMTGTKAAYLAHWAAANDLDFLRFDYSGHGQSSGDFLDGCISDWAQDAADIITARAKPPYTLVGSSMGGWIALLLARHMPQKIFGIVTIAAAPDFTEDSMWNSFTPAQKADLANQGAVQIPSDYGAPYTITQKLIADGRKNLVLRDPLHMPFALRMLQGTDDADVPPSVALRLLVHAQGADIHLTLVKGADHRFSSPDCLDLITQTIDSLPASLL
jgi:pimeloyl-ACP methyl ester carboxylesterase